MDEYGNNAIAPPLLSTCRLVRNEAVKLWFLRVHRNAAECRVMWTAVDQARPLWVAGGAGLVMRIAWDRQVASAHAVYCKARRMQGSTEDMLIEMGYPAAKWLACDMNEKW